MSKVGTYVEGSNGRYYSCPVIYTDEWYVCFDDDDPPEIVIRSFANSSSQSVVKRAKKFLRDAGFKYKNLEYSSYDTLRAFPPKWNLKKAGSCEFEIVAPFPTEGVTIHCDADFEIMPDIMQGTVYIWHRDFLVSEIKTLWSDEDTPERVLIYLGGTVQKCRNTVLKQIPEIRESRAELVRLRVRD